MINTNVQIDAKFEFGINRLVLEHNRFKLPKLVENLKLNPDSMMINSEWSSSWNQLTQSSLVESLLINIPIMPIIVYEKAYHSYEVIDGRERLKTIVDFYSDRLTLTGLEVETYLEGRIYSTLPVKVREQLDRRSLFSINCIPMNNNLTEDQLDKLINAVKERYTKQ